MWIRSNIAKALLLAVTTLVAANGVAQLPYTVDDSFQAQVQDINQTLGLFSLHFLPNGQLVTTGTAVYDWSNWPINPALGLVRLNADGSPDLSFNNSGGIGRLFPWQDSYYAMGKPKRTDINGFPDSDFADNTFISILFTGTHCVPLADSTVLIGGKHRVKSRVDTTNIPGEFCVVKLDKHGQPDTTFQHRICDFGGHTDMLVPMADGRVFVSGSVQGFYEGQPVGRLFRIWPDGSLDTTFSTSMFSGAATEVHQLPDGRLLCAGLFRFAEHPNDDLQVVRLLPNGDLDTTYNNFNGTNANIFALLHQLEPNVWIWSGGITQFNGQPSNQFIALDSTGNRIAHPMDQIKLAGTVNTGFPQGTARIKQAPDGSIFLFGGFGSIDDGQALYPDQQFLVKLHGLNVGINDAALSPSKGELALYPNPGNEVVNIALPTALYQGVFQVYDMQGKRVHAQQLSRTGSGMINYTTRELPPGMYQIIITGEQGAVWNGKWVRE